MSAESARPRTADEVIIAVDPHKASWTAVVVAAGLVAVGAIRVEVNRAGYRRLRRFAADWPEARWAIEGAAGLGAPLAERLREDGIAVIDVPAKLARRVRLLSTGHGRKSDQADALSVGIAAWSAPALRTAGVDEQIAALRAVSEHRDDLVRTRTQLVNRLHALLVKLVPSGGTRGLSAESAAAALRRLRPRDTLARTLRTLAADLVAELRRLDRRITDTTETLRAAVAASGTTLTQLLGVGDVVAAKLLARTGPITRFPSAAAFASFCGVAPIEVSSGDVVRHRLSRAGDRQLNYALHVMAIAQIRYDSPGRSYYQRKRAAGKSHKEAMPRWALLRGGMWWPWVVVCLHGRASATAVPLRAVRGLVPVGAGWTERASGCDGQRNCVTGAARLVRYGHGRGLGGDVELGVDATQIRCNSENIDLEHHGDHLVLVILGDHPDHLESALG